MSPTIDWYHDTSITDKYANFDRRKQKLFDFGNGCDLFRSSARATLSLVVYFATRPEDFIWNSNYDQRSTRNPGSSLFILGWVNKSILSASGVILTQGDGWVWTS